WRVSEAEFSASAAHWDNEDYVPVVILSYRHRFVLSPGDPAHEEIETALAKLPPIMVPSIDLHGGSDGVNPPPPKASSRFTGRFERRILPGIGHNPPQEAPDDFARALKDLVTA
ncbi:MAG: epoxide hydrolase protein, partial [Rubritepida sp.]|nr:epoxide hydrolase protein [Rubritepida sp.]